MIFEANINSNRFKYIEFYCHHCKTKGVSMDIKKTKCPECDKVLSDVWHKEKSWHEKN